MKKQAMKKLAKKIWLAVCLLVLCVNLIILPLSIADREDQRGWLPFGVLAVDSGSMEPVLSRGDLLLIHEVPYEELTVGDNVTFHNGKNFVTHRLVEKLGDTFITQGLANPMADLVPMSRSSYSGKVIAAVPLLGWPVQVVNASPWAVFLFSLLVLMLCLGQPLLEQLYQQKVLNRKAKYAAPLSWLPRALPCAAVISTLLVTPAVTEAKYLAQLDRYETLVAEPLYFSSNYLSEGEGNTYSIQGWTGESYSLSLEICNYDNTLLFNSAGMDLTYGIALEIKNSANDNYTIELKEDMNSDHDHGGEQANFPYPEDWITNDYHNRHNHTIPGGEAHARKFSVLVKPVSGHVPAEGEVIEFAIHACTSRNATYFKTLKGSFRLQVTQEKEFLGATEVAGTDAVITLTQTTNMVNSGSGSEGERLVVFRWKTDKVYLNEYQRTAFNAINSNSGNYKKEQGLLYMRLQPYSKIELEFFRKAGVTEPIGDNDFVVAEVENDQTAPDFGQPSKPETGEDVPEVTEIPGDTGGGEVTS